MSCSNRIFSDGSDCRVSGLVPGRSTSNLTFIYAVAKRAADHSPPSSAAVMEEYSYTSTHPLGHTGPVTGSLYAVANGQVSLQLHPISNPNQQIGSTARLRPAGDVLPWLRVTWTVTVRRLSSGAHCLVIIKLYFVIKVVLTYMRTAVAQWLRCCATNRKVAGSIPDGVTGIFH